MSNNSGGRIDLAGRWLLSDGTGEYSAEVDLPGDMISGLVEAELIPEPYVGRNEYQLRWIAERDWVVSRKFDIDQPDLCLVVSEVDTVADVHVNGRLVLECRNQFRSWRADLSDVLQTGENNIAIRFRSSVTAAAEAQAGQPFFVPWHFRNCPIPNGNMLRKVQCDFGWDWNIALAPFGLYGMLQLERARVPRLGDLQVAQTHTEHGVTVKMSVQVHDIKCAPDEAHFTIDGKQVVADYDPESSSLSASHTIRNPKLWWPAGQGEQALYRIEIQCGQATLTRSVGLTTIELVSEADQSGRSFCIRVNGRNIFCKGANWIPADALAGRISRDKVRELLQSAVDANMNMLRVWGGGRYEPDWFYELCDELGLMIWQDFMFSCHLYPATDAFLADVAAEVTENVSRLQHHPCMAVWCGDNELIGALTWFEASIRDRDRYLVAYDRLNRTIEAALREADSDANWWPSSPSPGPMSFGDAWHDDSSGDMHFWSVWHEGKDFEHYRDVAPRFCSEFGFQSYPSMEVIRQFAEPVDFNIASPVMESHQKNSGGNARIAETMFRYFRFPVGFENFVYLSQVQQGLAIKTAVTYWRSLKPHCMGTLFWQLNDTWPVCSWSSLNHGGSWKLLHYMARHFYADLLVTAVPVARKHESSGAIALWVCNDAPTAAETNLEVFALSMQGELRKLADASLSVSQAAALKGPVVEGLTNDELLYFRWSLPDGSVASDHFAPLPYKAYDLPCSEIAIETSHASDVMLEHGAVTVTLKSATLALFVAVEANVPGRFSDNVFCLLPGEPVTVRFTASHPDATPEFIVRDLRSATYSI